MNDRCLMTGNLVDTDTRPPGEWCQCSVCRLTQERDDTLLAEIWVALEER